MIENARREITEQNDRCRDRGPHLPGRLLSEPISKENPTGKAAPKEIRKNLRVSVTFVVVLYYLKTHLPLSIVNEKHAEN